MDGTDPIDYVFYEPQLPPGAPVGQSRRIVWTTTVRHPAKFSLALSSRTASSTCSVMGSAPCDEQITTHLAVSGSFMRMPPIT